jgi:phage replication-related protein YjqB (UPF0714/DUF867 family)
MKREVVAKRIVEELSKQGYKLKLESNAWDLVLADTYINKVENGSNIMLEDFVEHMTTVDSDFTGIIKEML